MTIAQHALHCYPKSRSIIWTNYPDAMAKHNAKVMDLSARLNSYTVTMEQHDSDPGRWGDLIRDFQL